jgi:hypothetical protein
MRVYNLTDVSTPVLEQRGLLDQHVAVAGRMVAPGEYVDVEDTPTARANIALLLQLGAMAIDKLPPPYVLARQQAAASSGKLAAHIGQRVELNETKVAGETPPAPPAEGATVVAEKHDPSSAPDELPALPQSEDPLPNQPPAPSTKGSGNKKPR